MADKKISAMAAAVSVAGADLVPIVQGGVNKKATVGQILEGVVTELDPTLVALAALDGSAGYLKQTGADAFSKVTAFSVADMVALRTFVRPHASAPDLGAGFFQANLFRITLGSPDSASGLLRVHCRILDATPKSGAFYYEVPIAFQRDANEIGGNLPALLIRSQYDGSTVGGATSIAFAQGAIVVSSPNITITLVIQPAGFTNPTVTMAATFDCPGDTVVTVL